MSKLDITAPALGKGFLARIARAPGAMGGFLTRDRRPRTVYLTSFFLPFLVMFILWACYGVWPFGSKMILAHDQWHQYYPFFVELRTRLKEGGSLLHSWTTGMGTSYLPLLAYYLASPMNLLSVLVPESLVLPYYTLTVLVKISLGGLFCAIFLQKTFRRPNLMIPFFSTAYALCAYVMGYYWNAIWLDTVALLPLVVLGFFALMSERRYVLYTVALFLSVLCNYYIGFFVCIFVLLLFIGYNIVRWDDLGGFFSRLGRIALFSLLAIGMTAALTIPTYLHIQSTSASNSKFPDRFALNLTDQPTAHKRMDAKTLTVKGDSLSLKDDSAVRFKVISYADGSVAFTVNDRFVTAGSGDQLYFMDYASPGGRWFPESEGGGFLLRSANESKKEGEKYLAYDGGFTVRSLDRSKLDSFVFRFFRRTTPMPEKNSTTPAPKSLDYEEVDRLRTGMQAIVLLDKGSRALTTTVRSRVNWSAVYDAFKTVVANDAPMVKPTSFSAETPNLYCGFAVLILGILFCFCRRIPLRERIFCVVLLLFLSASMIFKLLDYVWHGLHVPNMLPFRYSFLWSLVAVYMAYRLYVQIFRIRWWHLLLSALPLAFVIFCVVTVHRGDGTSAQNYLGILVSTAAVTAFVGTFLVLYSLRIVRKEVFSLALALCMLAESVVCAGLGVMQVSVTDGKIYPREKENTASVLQQMYRREEGSTDLWRAEVSKKQTLNDSALLGYRGISTFSSTANSRVSQFLQSIGMAASVAGNRYAYQEADPFTNLLLGVKYIIDREGTNTDPAYFKEVGSEGKALLLENKAYLPLGFMVDPSCLEYRPVDAEGGSFGNHPYDRLNALYREMTGVEAPLFSKLDYESVGTIGEAEIVGKGQQTIMFHAPEANSLKHCLYATFRMPRDGHLCIFSRSIECADIMVAVNDVSLYYYSDKYGYNRNMGEFKEGDKIMLYFRPSVANKDVKVVALQAAVFQDEVFAEGREKLAASQMITTRLTDTDIEGAIQVEQDGLLYLSIPYDEGWKLEVDGEHTRIVAVGGAMMAAHLAPGVHAIHLHYEPRGYSLGLKISLACLAVFAVLVILSLLWRLTRPPIVRVPMILEDPEREAEENRLAEAAAGGPVLPGDDRPAPGVDLSSTTTMPPLAFDGAGETLDQTRPFAAVTEETLRQYPAALPVMEPEQPLAGPEAPAEDLEEPFAAPAQPDEAFEPANAAPAQPDEAFELPNAAPAAPEQPADGAEQPIEDAEQPFTEPSEPEQPFAEPSEPEAAPDAISEAPISAEPLPAPLPEAPADGIAEAQPEAFADAPAPDALPVFAAPAEEAPAPEAPAYEAPLPPAPTYEAPAEQYFPEPPAPVEPFFPETTAPAAPAAFPGSASEQLFDRVASALTPEAPDFVPEQLSFLPPEERPAPPQPEKADPGPFFSVPGGFEP